MDEAYYWVWSKYLDISYYDHPPIVAYMIALTDVLGESERWVRLSAVVSASIITWLVYAIASDASGDRKKGFMAAILLNLSPLFGLGGLVITPDIPLCLFWTVSLYFGYKVVDTQRPGYWYALGLVFGLTMLSKYNAALFAPALGLFLVFSPENRHWLFRREPYLAFALSMMVFSPVIYWNYTHNWISFGFQFSHGFEAESSQPLLYFSRFWGGQIGILGGLLFFFSVAAAFGIGWIGWKERRDDYLFLSFMSASLFIFFMVNSFRTNMEGNWSAPAYIAGITAIPIFVTYFAERLGTKNSNRLVSLYKASIALAAFIMVYASVQIVDPILPMPQKREISRRVYGWKALAAEAEERLERLREAPFIISNRYQIASLLRYYTPGHVEAYITNGKGRFGYFGSVAHLIGKDAVYVTEADRADISKIAASFERIEPAGSFKITRRGELIREFSFYKCYNYRGGLIEI